MVNWFYQPRCLCLWKLQHARIILFRKTGNTGWIVEALRSCLGGHAVAHAAVRRFQARHSKDVNKENIVKKPCEQTDHPDLLRTIDKLKIVLERSRHEAGRQYAGGRQAGSTTEAQAPGACAALRSRCPGPFELALTVERGR